jgi:hypothetical protein
MQLNYDSNYYTYNLSQLKNVIFYSVCYIHALTLVLLFEPEDGGDILLRNVG